MHSYIHQRGRIDMSRRKFKKGARITSLDHFANCEWIITHGKTYTRGWAQSWQFLMVKNCISNGWVYEGIRLTNAEYYSHLSDKRLKERFNEEFHAYCPWTNGYNHSPQSVCEGQWCDEAMENWKGATVK